MWCRSRGWETSCKRQGSLSLKSTLELSEDGVGGKGKNLGVEDLSGLENLGDLHLVRERIDLQFIEKKSLSSINLISDEDDLLGSNDLNLGLDNLGCDLKLLEETSLLWIKTGGSSWDNDIIWSDHTSLSWGWSNLGVKDSLDFGEVSVGEDDVDVTLKLLENKLDVWVESVGL